ncbi:hypothetical protein FB390_6641 [Nocardia bhagyanarayanae]|uniref:Uncharacterized protein n=1 Tax=Nocardia bhagyanarayanae TaxID=1215925 RepID=A0A543EXY0_9NOCA|nr:hypothetical protein FB390_6641 [Nocardia bhagyanarayanae]
MDKATAEARNLISLKTAAALVDVGAKTTWNWIAAGVLRERACCGSSAMSCCR